MRITTIIPRRGINDDGLGKKHALCKLIGAAETEYVYLTDDDATLPTCSEEEMLAEIGDADLLILPLRMTGGDSLIERLQIAEYAALQQLTVEMARRGHAVMCSGASLLVRRSTWLESMPDLHPEIPGGDDMFLLESFKRRGCRIVTTDTAWACVQAQPKPGALLRQRMRWASKAPRYTDRDILVCGALVAAANLLQVVFLPVLLVKFPIEYYLIKKRDPKVSLGIALLLELIYPWYMLICLVGGLLHPQRW